ncbi:MAG: OB-fold nucleic acid binding domain-containing protein [bacterium]
MTSEINDSDRIYVFLEECRRMDIEVLPPDINESGVDFSVIGEKIRFGLRAVKNVGEGPAGAIVSERPSSKYRTLADLCSRVAAHSVNRRTLESLITAGACDSLEGHRAQLLAALEPMIEFGQKVAQATSSHDLFAQEGGVVERVAPLLPDIPPWSSSDRLANEKEMLGYYVSGHPLQQYRDELQFFTTGPTTSLAEMSDGREVTVGGLFSQIKTMIDKKGNTMAFATLEDFTGAVELLLFSSTYEKFRQYIELDRMVLVSGRVSTREGEAPKILVGEVLPLEQLTERFNCQLVIKIDQRCSDDEIDRVLDSLGEFEGNTPVLLAAGDNGSEVYIRSRKYNVRPGIELLTRVKAVLGEANAYFRPLNRKDDHTENR